MIGFALTGVKADERETLLSMLDNTAAPSCPTQTIIANKNYFGHAFEQKLTDAGITLLRGTRTRENSRLDSDI